MILKRKKMLNQEKVWYFFGAIFIYAVLEVLQINLPPLHRYPNWDAFWIDTLNYGHLAVLKKALINFEIPAISPYMNFGWNFTGDTTNPLSFLNPLYWSAIILPAGILLQMRTVFFFLIAAGGVFLFIREITRNQPFSFLLAIIYISLPININLTYGTIICVFLYFSPIFLYLIHKCYSVPTLKWILIFLLCSIAAAISGNIYNLITLPVVIGVYTFIIGFTYFRQSIGKSFLKSFLLIIVWLLGSACYIFPLLYNLLINSIAMTDISNAGIFFPTPMSLSDFIAYFKKEGFVGSFFSPVDAGTLMYYVPSFCYVMLAASLLFRKKIFQEDPKLFSVVCALLITTLFLFLESFVCYSIPFLAKRMGGVMRGQTALFSYFVMLASCLCVHAVIISNIKEKLSNKIIFIYFITFVIILSFVVDMLTFIFPISLLKWLLPGSKYIIHHISPQLESSNLISVNFRKDMWPILPFVNLGILISIILASRCHPLLPSLKKIPYLSIVFFSAFISLFSLSLHNQLRTQQIRWAWQVNDPHLWNGYKVRKECINNLIERNQYNFKMNFRTLYTGKPVFDPARARNWKLIAETELNPIEGEKVLFQYRETVHPYTALLWSAFYKRPNYFRSQGHFLPLASVVENSIDLARFMGVKWIISADQKLENKALIYKGVCSTKGGSLSHHTKYEEGDLYVYELSKPLGIAFLIDRYKVLENKDILNHMFKQTTLPWTENIVYLEEDPPLQQTNDLNFTKNNNDNFVEIIEETFNNIILKVKSNHEQFLVLSYTYLPNWSAYIDNHPQKIFRAYGGFMAIKIPPGEYKVKLRYFPIDIYLGTFISFCSVLFVFLMILRKRRSVRKSLILSIEKKM